MKIVSWNINGIRSIHRKGFLGIVKKISPDIICLQEIKAREEDFPSELINPNGYHSFLNPAERKGYSGTACYSKIEPLKTNKKIGYQRFDEEGRMLELIFNNFHLFNFYIPFGGRKKENLEYKLEVYNKLISIFEKLKNKNVIMVGDFNIAHTEIDLARPKENKNSIMFTPEERRMIDKIISLGYIDTFRYFNKEGGHYSWWPYYRNARERNLGWRIDYTFISKPLESKLKKAFILKDIYGSDHCPVGVDIEF